MSDSAERPGELTAAPPATAAAAAAASVSVADLLAFERQWAHRPAHSGAKEQAIRDRFGLNATAYYQLLNAAVETVDALAIDPVTTRRLQRVRGAAVRSRPSLEPRGVPCPTDLTSPS